MCKYLLKWKHSREQWDIRIKWLPGALVWYWMDKIAKAYITCGLIFMQYTLLARTIHTDRHIHYSCQPASQPAIGTNMRNRTNDSTHSVRRFVVYLGSTFYSTISTPCAVGMSVCVRVYSSRALNVRISFIHSYLPMHTTDTGQRQRYRVLCS